MKKITLDKKKEIVAYYLSKPMTVDCCSKYFMLSAPTIIKILDMFHTKRWSKAELFSPDLDEHYFDEIDSPQKAYWLGLLMTDGRVFEKKGKTSRLCLTLKKEDEYLIGNFLSDIHCNKKIVHTQGRAESSVQISSNLLCYALSKYGVVPRKTGKQHFICPAYQDAYFHGLIDGDGSISFYARAGGKSHHKNIRLCGANREFLEEVISYIGCGIIEKSHDGLNTITWRRNDDMMRVITAIKRYDTYCLTRKMNLIDNVFNEIREYRDNYKTVVS